MTWKSLLAGGLELGPRWVREEVPATPSCRFGSRGQCELAQVQDLAVFSNGVALGLCVHGCVLTKSGKQKGVQAHPSRCHGRGMKIK